MTDAIFYLAQALDESKENPTYKYSAVTPNAAAEVTLTRKDALDFLRAELRTSIASVFHFAEKNDEHE